MKSIFRSILALVAWVLMVAVLAGCEPADASERGDYSRSPVPIVFVDYYVIPELNDGFARIRAPMLVGSTIVGVEILNVKPSKVAVYYYSDPSETWIIERLLEFTADGHPVVSPGRNVIGAQAGLVIWDGGEVAPEPGG